MDRLSVFLLISLAGIVPIRAQVPGKAEILSAMKSAARYYELESNRPLYMIRKGSKYALTHDDASLPSHYGWKSQSRLDALKIAWDSLFQGKDLTEWELPPIHPDPAPAPEEVLAALDDQGRWISTFAGEPLVGQPKFRKGESYLGSDVFSRNLRILSAAFQEKE